MKLTQQAVVLAVLAATATSATASIPSQCTDPIPKRRYTTGYNQGVDSTNTAWNDFQPKCADATAFSQIIKSNLANYTINEIPPSRNTVCRYGGYVTGVLDTVDSIMASCNECYALGKLIGEVSAIAYCELSIALQGLGPADDFLRGPVTACGVNYQDGCDRNFEVASQDYSNGSGICLPYTADPFSEIWRSAELIQCAYNPIPQPTP